MKTDWQVMKRLLQILSPMKWIMLFSASMRITKMVGDTALIAVAAGTVFYYVAEPSSAVLWQGAMWLVITAAIVGTSHYLEQFSGHYVAFVLLAKLRNMFYDSMEPLAPAKTAKLQTGDAIGRVMSDWRTHRAVLCAHAGPGGRRCLCPDHFAEFLVDHSPVARSHHGAVSCNHHDCGALCAHQARPGR